MPSSHHVLAVIGARPQFIKLAPVAVALRRQRVSLKVVHTGQHYDNGMSTVFFRQLGLPKPHYHLGISGGSHGVQTGRMLEKIEAVIEREAPGLVLVFGDTNSTLSGALAAGKMKVPIAHIEAGMRSFNWEMPEEVNRMVTDHLATLHYCATKSAVQNLHHEGVTKNVFYTGDVMADLLRSSSRQQTISKLGRRLKLRAKQFLLVTVHRPSNADSLAALNTLLSALNQLTDRVVFPVHPRTKHNLVKWKLWSVLAAMKHVHVIDPVGYFDMIWLERNARAIVTDSGGMQKEAYLVGTPCVTLRDETEWVETVRSGWNTLTGMNVDQIIRALQKARPRRHPLLYGDGHASDLVARSIKKFLSATKRRPDELHPHRQAKVRK